jgi:hypothetical protein
MISKMSDRRAQSQLDEIREAAQFVCERAREHLGSGFGFNLVGVKWLAGFIEETCRQGDTGYHAASVLPVGAFLGECIINTFGGDWVKDDGGWLVRINSNFVANPFGRVRRHLENGPSDCVLSYFEVIPSLIERTRDPVQ